MSKIIFLMFLFFSLNKIAIANDNEFLADDLFHIDQMNSHNKDFALYFKGREKSILARGETEIILMIIQKIFIFMITKLKLHLINFI